MKKPIMLSLIIAGMALITDGSTPASAQSPANDNTPTFYRLTPGTYVNGWPRFTIHYPKDWSEERRTNLFSEVFVAVGPPPAPRPILTVNVFSTIPRLPPTPPVEFYPLPLEKFADVVLPVYRVIAKGDVTVVSNKPATLKDGTPAWEVETKMFGPGMPQNCLNIGTKRGEMWVNTGTNSFTGKIEEYQRVMLSSLWYEPGKDVPVKVPQDVAEFLDSFCSAVVSHDVSKVMAHYSDRFLHSGTRKGLAVEEYWRLWIRSYTSSRVGAITDFIVDGDRAYLAGYFVNSFGIRAINETSIIKENGQWKWYGNQRDVTR